MKSKYILYMFNPDTKQQLPGYKEFNHSHPLRSYVVKMARQEGRAMFMVDVE